MSENDEFEDENKELNDLWDKAMYNARMAFEKTFNDDGYDPAYWTIRIVSHKLSIGFDSILETKTWDEYGNYELKEMITK